MTGRVTRCRRQGADSASHAKLCNPFLPEGDRGRRGNRAQGREPSAEEGS
jgi:hypothetical protein